MASAIALLGCLASLEAHAVALGRITVQSALGESLRAEIDISDLSADEAASLRVGVAGADVFRAAGLEYSAAASGLDVRLQRRPDGRPYLRLTSNRAIGEPFVDLVLEARWASGRVTRDYTMLFDPPNLRNSNAPLVASSPVLPREPVAVSSLAPRQELPLPVAKPAAPAVPRAPRPQAIRTPPAQSTSGTRQVTVRPGDNASRIAAQNKPASVSLDQMLVALLRGNPDAFVGGNINLIKSGAVVDIPDAQAANALSPGEARQMLIAQSRDFNTFRRKLADGVPATPLDNADRQAAGKVQTRVDDRAQASNSPDRLTLSKGAVQGMPSGEQSARDAENRTTEQSKNTSALNPQAAIPGAGSTAPGVSVAGSSAASAAGGVPAVPASPALTSSGAAEPATGASSPSAVAESAPEAPVSEPMPSASAPASVVPAAASQQAALTAPPVAPPEPGLTTWIMDNSLLLGGGILLALLAGLGFARYRKNAGPSHVDSSFLDSRLQPDSFFGASGGQRVDTSTNHASKSSSIAYSPSQLDAAGDVDPVAEADVYLAYGRDQQAEEILKEALQTYPARLAIHSKLLEIHAKRRDNKAFENAALAAFKLTGGQGAEWSYISQLGRELEPSNSMYQSGASFSTSLPGIRNSGLVPLSSTVPQTLAGLAPVSKTPQILDLDLDLDFPAGAAASASMPHALTTAGAIASPVKKTEPMPDIAIPSAFLDLDLDLDDVPAAAPAANPQHLSVALPSSGFDLIANGMDFTSEPFAPKAAIAPTAPVMHSGMLEFDLDSLSLDLGPVTKPSAASLTSPDKDPLEIKFLLAEEFRTLGDSEGARSLADEVVAHAKGPLKFKAQAFLNTLS
ncbi:MAG: FimV/HubP family polar landmark protein [Polaromonas sp.]